MLKCSFAGERKDASEAINKEEIHKKKVKAQKKAVTRRTRSLEIVTKDFCLYVWLEWREFVRQQMVSF
jgi:hypothetical protein